MHIESIAALQHAQAEAGVGYHEFLRVPALSAGLYHLPAGGTDRQQPHGEDEIYYVLGGQATVQAGETERAVGPGDLIYVPARVPHRFVRIASALDLLVFFAPAEGSAAGASAAEQEVPP